MGVIKNMKKADALISGEQTKENRVESLRLASSAALAVLESAMLWKTVLEDLTGLEFDRPDDFCNYLEKSLSNDKDRLTLIAKLIEAEIKKEKERQ